jgi:predicted small secreted protein
MVRKIVVAACATLFALTATACNTVRGAGEDVQDVSNDVDDAI